MNLMLVLVMTVLKKMWTRVKVKVSDVIVAWLVSLVSGVIVAKLVAA